MAVPRLDPVDSQENLRSRILRLIKKYSNKTDNPDQLPLEFPSEVDNHEDIEVGFKSIGAFLDYTVDAMPDGEVYIFGGVIRDMALFGKRGFNSDFDLVVEGDWSNLVSHLNHINAKKNKFGGFRLKVCGWPVDIWNAKDTWAIKQGIVPYEGILSLTKTTVLNWDGILMNWRTKSFIHGSNYFDDITSRTMDIVLEENPNPKGMAVRVFRHLCEKSARRITPSVASYLAKVTKNYSFECLREAEIKSYKNSAILEGVYRYFKYIDLSKGDSIEHPYSLAKNIMMKELGLDNQSKN